MKLLDYKMFWKKTKLPIRSDEFEELCGKIVSIVRQVDILSNKVALLSDSCKSNRANIGVLKRREKEEEIGTSKKDDFLPKIWAQSD